jgi:hypothetical protein
MSPKGRPKGESAPKRVSAEGSPLYPKGRPEGASGLERAARRVVHCARRAASTRSSRCAKRGG